MFYIIIFCILQCVASACSTTSRYNNTYCFSFCYFVTKRSTISKTFLILCPNLNTGTRINKMQDMLNHAHVVQPLLLSLNRGAQNKWFRGSASSNYSINLDPGQLLLWKLTSFKLNIVNLRICQLNSKLTLIVYINTGLPRVTRLYAGSMRM